MATQTFPLLTVQQYLDLERAAEFRSEYIDGQIYAMAGGGRNHALIAMEVGSSLNRQLRGKSCAAAGSDLRLYSKQEKTLTYPDIVVFCEPARFLDADRDTLTDATVIVEVLSKSTQNYDRGEKFRAYRTLPSFAEYLLLAQNEIRAEHHVRQPDGTWLFRESKSPDTQIHLAAIGCTLTLGDLYERVEFAPAS